MKSLPVAGSLEGDTKTWGAPLAGLPELSVIRPSMTTVGTARISTLSVEGPLTVMRRDMHVAVNGRGGLSG
ncbi:hypothetical protein NL529_33400, partial [Klebsiella pneumoniae]|nr:hypothetical protein [Klebsiella pneumoniae]